MLFSALHGVLLSHMGQQTFRMGQFAKSKRRLILAELSFILYQPKHRMNDLGFGCIQALQLHTPSGYVCGAPIHSPAAVSQPFTPSHMGE